MRRRLISVIHPDVLKESPAYAAQARYLPFAVFMAFIGIEESVRFAASKDLLTNSQNMLYLLYPIKTVVVATVLFHYRQSYTELSLKDLAHLPTTATVGLMGILVFFLWINMDWAPLVSGRLQGFNPAQLSATGVKFATIAFRIAGAVLVVPLMEELFWRSFLIRYIVDQNFAKVPIGSFTWPSFLLTVVLFGLEHHFVLAGMVAGILYSIVLYRTRSLVQCVLAHAVTNLALAIYVISTGKWYFW